MASAGNFVCAATPSVINHSDLVFKYHPGYLNNDSLNKFFQENCNKFLSSVGYKIYNKEKGVDKNLFKRYKKQFDKIVKAPYMKGMEVTLDSAGYQFQTGVIPKAHITKFLDMYHNFLIEEKDNYKYAFVFDPVPGATKDIISSYEEMKKLNLQSLDKTCSMDESVLSKMIYIHHFRTPEIYRLYKELMYDYKYMDKFNNFATGGLVSFLSSSKSRPPCVMYMVPLVDTLCNAINRGLKSFRFHVLGSADFKDILFHEFISHHIRKVHGIEIELTYDSSTVFKTWMMGRYIYVPSDDGGIDYMFLKSDELKMQQGNKGTKEQYFYDLINEIAIQYGLTQLDPKKEPIYEDSIYNSEKNLNEGGTISRVIYVYGILFMLKLYNLCGVWCKEFVKENYPLYESGHTNEFDNRVEKMFMKLSYKKTLKNAHYRTTTLVNSMNMINKLDPEYGDYLVNRYMAKDECSSLLSYSEGIF